MFGISIGELLLVGAVALMVVGPSRLPKMLSTLGRWIGKLRRITNEVRHQTGIDDLLRQEGLKGGLNELRGLVRGDVRAVQRLGQAATRTAGQNPSAPASRPAASARPAAVRSNDAYSNVPHDRSREYPPEGCDAYGALPDDLFQNLNGAPEDAEPPPPESAPPLSPVPRPDSPSPTTR